MCIMRHYSPIYLFDVNKLPHQYFYEIGYTIAAKILALWLA
jgi:hypothetical protein